MNKILEKIKQFFHKFKKEAKYLPTEKMEDEKNEQKDFKASLDVKDEQKIRILQKQYEEGTILEEDLTPFQVMDLIELYKKQIQNLSKKCC